MSVDDQLEKLDSISSVVQSFMDSGLHISNSTCSGFAQQIEKFERVLKKENLPLWKIDIVVQPYRVIESEVMKYMTEWHRLSEFKECALCASKLGSPLLCKSCLHNRSVITELDSALKDRAVELRRLADDLDTIVGTVYEGEISLDKDASFMSNLLDYVTL